MTYTIWSNASRFEYLVYDGGALVARSGLVFGSRAAAKRAMMKAVA